VTDTLILRTRPTTVEARRFTEDSDREQLARWVGGWTHREDTEIRWFDRDTGTVTVAPLGSWIVKTAFGHYKPVSDAAIFAQYDRVGPAVSE
jgi:hypothetical protein